MGRARKLGLTSTYIPVYPSPQGKAVLPGLQIDHMTDFFQDPAADSSHFLLIFLSK
jgi:hypothetical protein